MSDEKGHEIEEYGDPGIESCDAKVPSWLRWSYILLPFWGIITFYFFWNGSTEWRQGYWRELQNAAKTTFPIVNFEPSENQEEME